MFCTLAIFGQERVTNIKEEIRAPKMIALQYNGASYLLAIKPTDELSVSRVESPDSITHLSDIALPGLFQYCESVTDYKIIDHFFIVRVGNDVNVIDFLTEQLYAFKFNNGFVYNGCSKLSPNEISIGSWKIEGVTQNHDQYIFNTQDFSFTEWTVPDYFIGVNHPSKLIKYKYSNEIRTYTQYDRLTNTINPIVSIKRANSRFTVKDSIASYVDDQGQGVSYNAFSNTFDYTNLYIAQDSLGSYGFLDRDGYYIFSAKPTKQDTTFVTIYQKSNKQKVAAFKLNRSTYISMEESRVLHGNFIVKANNQTLLIYNFANKILYEENMFDYSAIKFIGDRHIYYRNYDFFTNQHIHNIWDIQNSTKRVLNNHYGIAITFFETFIPIKDKFLLAFDLYENIGENIFILDTAQMSLEYKSDFQENNKGIRQQSDLIKINNKIILVTKDLYLLDEGASPFKLNQVALSALNYNENHLIRNGNLYFVTQPNGDDILLYKYDGTNNTLMAQLPAKSGPPFFEVLYIHDIAETKDYIFISTRVGNFYKYGKTDQSWTKISEDKIDFINTPNTHFYFFKGEYYFVQNGLNKINAEGNIVSLNLPFGLGKGLSHFENSLIVFDQKTMSTYSNGTLKPIIVSSTLDVQLFYFGQNTDASGSHFLATDNDYIYHYNGTDVYKLDNDYYIIPGRSYNKLFLLSQFDGFKNSYFVFDCEKRGLIKLNTIDGSFRDLILTSKDTIMVTKSGDYITFHRLQDNFTNAVLSQSFFYPSFGDAFSLVTFGNEGLLLGINGLYLMNDKNEFFPIDKLKGPGNTSKPQEKNGYVYFMAFDPSLGRQVYKIQLFSARVGVIDLKTTKVSIYPNPANLSLNIHDATEFTHYHIINKLGAEIAYGQISNDLIDIASLPSGFYTLKLSGSKNQGVAAFVKM